MITGFQNKNYSYFTSQYQVGFIVSNFLLTPENNMTAELNDDVGNTYIWKIDFIVYA